MLSELGRRGGHFIHAKGFDPFGSDGIAFGRRHAGIGVEHLGASTAAPGEKTQEMVFADGAGSGWGVGFGEAVCDAAMYIVHTLSFSAAQYAGRPCRFSSGCLDPMT